MQEEKKHTVEMHEHSHDHSYQHEYSHDHNHDHSHQHEHSHDHNHDHSHQHGHGHDHNHEHSYQHGHGHTHSHAHTKAVLNRLSRAIGHLESIRRMVEDGRDCTEVLIQLSAVKAAINNTGKVILQDHIEHCIVEAVEDGDKQAIADLMLAIERFIK